MQVKKYYIVWEGLRPGIYTSWKECQQQVHHHPNAKYKSYKGISREEAERIYQEGPSEKESKEPGAKKKKYTKGKVIESITQLINKGVIIPDAIAVDASTRNNPGPMEYRGVIVETGDIVFQSKVYPLGTNNIGEFLAIVHAMSWMKLHDYKVPIYSDSINAIDWVNRAMCKTTLKRDAQTEELFNHIERAIRWIKTNDVNAYEVIKWETKKWGEIPADYGRK